MRKYYTGALKGAATWVTAMSMYVLNSVVIMDFGIYRYSSISREEARRLLTGGFISAVGHPEAARVASEILGVEIPVNRIEIRMVPGDRAVVVRLKRRPEAGAEVSAPIEDYEIGLLERLS